VKLPTTARIPRLLAPNEVQSILDSCGHLRDRLLFALLHEAGIRIGEALGLRHEDIAVAEREITVRTRTHEQATNEADPRGHAAAAEQAWLHATEDRGRSLAGATMRAQDSWTTLKVRFFQAFSR
jgi:integrase